MAQKRPRSQSPPSEPGQIFRSGSIKDRGSTFIAIYSPTVPAKELQDLSEFSSATHRIAGWRVPSNQRTLVPGRPACKTGHDDDGESYAGRRVENVLKDLDVVGSVMVARWYGGVMLGPVRFTHIEDCAKEAIGKWREQVEGEQKRRRLEIEDAAKKESLVKALGQRDQSIVALRGLLAEKQDREVPKPAATPDYAELKLAVLEKLEKARDKSIEYLLKELDKVDEKAKLESADQTVSNEQDDIGRKS